MPEGPEIKRLALRLDKVLAGRRLDALRFSYRDFNRFDEDLGSQEILKVDSRGKALLLYFESGLTLYTHNQLYGKWLIVRKGKVPKTNRTQRLVISTERHSAFLYSASSIEILDPVQAQSHSYLSKLGPDALDDETTWEQIYEQLSSKRFVGRALGSLLLDQSFVAGIGNYLRSEILYYCGLNPADKPKSVSGDRLKVLAKKILEVTRQAFLTAGVTNDPKRVSELKEKGLSRSKYRFAVFSRAGFPCYICGDRVKRIESNGRRLYLCRECQPLV